MKRINLYLLFVLLACTFNACVKDEIYNGPATISDLVYKPASVTPDDIVTVSVNAVSIRGIKSVDLYYKVNAGSYTAVAMTEGSKDIFSGKIAKQADKSEVTFYVKAVTNGGAEGQSAEKTYKVGAVAPNYSAIVLNEVDGNKKFVELYNNSDNAVNISGMAIIKNGTSLKYEDGSANWVVPTGIVLPARGYGIIKCSGYTATADAGAVIIGAVGDGMSAKQTLLLELTAPGGLVVNNFQRGVAPWSVTISAIAATDSYSRCPDATGPWKTALSSPGKSNTAATGDIPAQ